MTAATHNPLSGLFQPTQLEKLYYGPLSVQSHLLDSLPSQQSKALIITGKSLSRTPLIGQVERLLGSKHAATISNIRQHAPVGDIDPAVDKALADPQIDTIISVGGGSPIDSAKLISYRINERSAQDKSGNRFLYHIAIPTTLSAAECTQSAGHTLASGQKTTVADSRLVPHVVIYDSTFVHPHTPTHLFASTGMRALDHALETLYHPTASEIARRMAVGAVADLFECLPKYQATSDDDQMITRLQLAAFASLGFLGLNIGGSGLGLSHALGHALGAPYSIPHGITSCITLGKIVQWKAAQGGDNAAQLCRACGAAGVTRTGDDVKDAAELGKAVEKLVQQIGMNKKLGEYQVSRDQAKVITKTATKSDSGPTYDAVLQIVESFW